MFRWIDPPPVLGDPQSETLKYKGIMLAWTNAPGVSSPVPSYGLTDMTPTWNCIRDGRVLAAFSKWWASKGNVLSEGSTPTSGPCLGILVAELDDAHKAALDAFALGITQIPSSGGPWPPQPGQTPPPVQQPPPPLSCAATCETKYGASSTTPNPTAYIACITNCASQAIPGLQTQPTGWPAGVPWPFPAPSWWPAGIPFPPNAGAAPPGWPNSLPWPPAPPPGWPSVIPFPVVVPGGFQPPPANPPPQQPPPALPPPPTPKPDTTLTAPASPNWWLIGGIAAAVGIGALMFMGGGKKTLENPARGRRNDRERELWVLNDEGLYHDQKRSRLSMREYIRRNRDEIDRHIDSVLNRAPRLENASSFFETGVFEHEGQTYEAGGGYYDAAAGVLVGYPSKDADGRWHLKTWNGKVITPLHLTRTYRGGFGRTLMHSWSASYDGKHFTGRNSGGEMILRMRATRRDEEEELLENSKWSRAYVNRLPDDAFFYVEPGGRKDAENKTVPRSLRHFPYKDLQGRVNVAHVKAALSRIPQSDVSPHAKERAMDRARVLYAQHGGYERYDNGQTYQIEARTPGGKWYVASTDLSAVEADAYRQKYQSDPDVRVVPSHGTGKR